MRSSSPKYKPPRGRQIGLPGARVAGMISPRERIDRAAYALFSRHGTKGVGIDAVLERSGVAKATLYRHYRSKDELILGFLKRREQVWTRDWLAAELERRGKTPKQRLLAMFDIFDGWFRKPDFE